MFKKKEPSIAYLQKRNKVLSSMCIVLVILSILASMQMLLYPESRIDGIISLLYILFGGYIAFYIREGSDADILVKKIEGFGKWKCMPDLMLCFPATVFTILVYGILSKGDMYLHVATAGPHSTPFAYILTGSISWFLVKEFFKQGKKHITRKVARMCVVTHGFPFFFSFASYMVVALNDVGGQYMESVYWPIYLAVTIPLVWFGLFIFRHLKPHLVAFIKRVIAEQRADESDEDLISFDRDSDDDDIPDFTTPNSTKAKVKAPPKPKEEESPFF